jgi:hypothetical protein
VNQTRPVFGGHCVSGRERRWRRFPEGVYINDELLGGMVLPKLQRLRCGRRALVVNRVIPVLRPQSEKVTFTLNADASIPAE